ncbi:Hypothetical protein PHPALM_7401 [Phytophthora palmivora]|uniref:Uncharacterized protein n=1 Tax=Phytophthora palmivora TaxID=4796 RepID=A0A2P4YCG4_9STRA|nr:Hypothetical protein PHPALM_7401 [Phytophthora palmivora]
MKIAKVSSLMTKLLRVSTHRSSYHTTRMYPANFRMSGTHSRHFKNFVRGQHDLRPESLSNVRGGMYAEDEYDLLAMSPATPTHESRSSMSTTLSRQNNSKKRTGRSPLPSSSHDSDSMDVLLTHVGRIVTARETEVPLRREQDQEKSVRVRAKYHKMLDDIRKRN